LKTLVSRLSLSLDELRVKSVRAMTRRKPDGMFGHVKIAYRPPFAGLEVQLVAEGAEEIARNNLS